MKQLKMIYRNDGSELVEFNLPASLELRPYSSEYVDDYIDMLSSAGFTGWTEAKVKEQLEITLNNGLLLYVDKKTEKIAATASAQFVPNDSKLKEGQIGWVGVRPEFRGQGLGYGICREVMQKLTKAGYRDITLLTDDWRLAAIKTYLNLNWIPLLYTEGMSKRWQEVCSKFDIDYNAIEKVVV